MKKNRYTARVAWWIGRSNPVFLSLARVYDKDLSAQCVDMLSMRYDR